MAMADPLRPAPPLNAERELPERATPSHIGHIPGTPETVNPRLNSAAETVGSALGTAVANVRQLPDRLQDAKKRFTVISGRKQQDAREVADEAIVRIREAGAEAKEEAELKLKQARIRAQEYVHQYPLHVIAGAAAFGTLLGFVMRIWRDHAN